MSEYDDIKTLKETGIWPNGVVPDWASLEAERLSCLSTHAAVIERGLIAEIERLRSKQNARILREGSV